MNEMRIKLIRVGGWNEEKIIKVGGWNEEKITRV